MYCLSVLYLLPKPAGLDPPNFKVDVEPATRAKKKLKKNFNDIFSEFFFLKFFLVKYFFEIAERSGAISN
jgi:hypothetical protein